MFTIDLPALTAADLDDYAAGVTEVMEAPFGAGLIASATGGERHTNPHPVETTDWQEWLRGFEAWNDAPKVTIEVPSDQRCNEEDA